MLSLGSWIRAALRWGKVTFPIAGVVLLPTDARACAVCVGWAEGQALNGGFYWSALLLTALPFAVVAVIGAWVGYAAWRTRSHQPSDSAESTPLQKP